MVTENSRKIIFRDFWNLPTWAARKAFIRGLIATRQPKGKAHRKQPENVLKQMRERKELHDCYLHTDDGRKVLVSKKLVISTLCIGEDQLRRWTGHAVDESVSGALQNTKSNRKETGRISAVKDWLNCLPKVPSHYCRSSSSKNM